VRKTLLYTLCVFFIAVGHSYCDEPVEGAGTPILDTAHQVAQSISSGASRIEALCYLARFYAEAGAQKKARTCFSEAQKAGEGLIAPDRIWTGPAQMLHGAGLYEYAFEAAKVLEDQSVKAPLLGEMAEELAERGKLEMAREIVDVLKADMEQIKSAARRQQLLVQCGRAYAKLGDKKAASKSFREALELLQSDEMAGSSEGLVHRTLADYGRACPYEEVRTAAEYLYEKPRLARSLQQLGEALLKDGRKEAAERAFGDALAAVPQIEDISERALAQATLATRNAAIGRDEYARQGLREFLASMDSISDPDVKDDLWKAVAEVRAELGELEQALEAAHNITDAYDLSDAVVKVAYKLAEAAQLQKALSQIEGVPKDFVKEKALANLAGLCAAAGDYDEAIGVIEKIGRPAYRTSGLVAIARAMIEKGDYERAIHALVLVPSKAGIKDTVATEVVTQCIEAAKKQNASANLALATGAVQIMDFEPRKWNPMVSIANQYEAAGLGKEALETLETAQDLARSLEPASTRMHARMLTLAGRARICAALGRMEEARKLVGEISGIIESITVSEGKERFLESALKELLDKGRQFELASQLLDSVTDAAARANGISYEAGQYAASGQADAAAEAMGKGWRWMANVADPLRQVRLLSRAAQVARERNIPIREAGRTVLRQIALSAQARIRQQAARAEQLRATAGQGVASLVFFMLPGCQGCRQVDPILEKFKATMPDVVLREFNLRTREGAALNRALCDVAQVPMDKWGTVPSVFSSEVALIGREITLPSLKRLANSARGKPAPWEVAQQRGAWAPTLGFFTIVSGGLLDGVNPCAFTVIIFFMAYLGYLKKEKNEIVAAGILFTVAVFATYFAVGLGLLEALKLGDRLITNFSKIIQGLTAAFVLVVAVLSLLDGLRCLQGRAEEMRLRLPEKLRSRIRLMISRKARLGLTVAAALALGCVVSLFELPCTGQVYVAILPLLHSEGFRGHALAWLLLYNLCFVLPLIIVFVGVFLGLTSGRLTSLFQRHMAKVKFALAALFFLLFGVMLLVMFRGT